MSSDAPPTVPGHGSADVETKETRETADSFVRAVAATPAVEPGLAIGDVIDETFRIEARLGAGGMGVVYRATDLRLSRQVAVKLHLPGLGMAERTEREAKVMARLSHPNVVTVYEVGEWRDRIYIAMEYLDGGTLRGWLRAKKRTRREVIAIFLAAARGLAAAHDAGLVHRDFKPDNVLLGSDGRVRVGDFGVAQPVGEAGDVAGTPGFMAPEAERGDDVDARADQYSYCVALRAALAPGKPPRWIARILARGLDADPGKRWPSMAMLAARLERARRGRRIAIASAAAAIVLAGVAVAIAWPRAGALPDRRCSGGVAEMMQTWSPSRADAVKRRVTDALSPVAAALAVGEIGAWSREWVDMHRAACEATSVRGEQSQALLDLRMACLERGRAQLDGVVTRIASDDDAARSATDAVDALPPVARCGNLLAVRGTHPLPDDASRVTALEAQLADALARASTGDDAGAFQAVQALLPAIRAAGWDPLLADALLHLGLLTSAIGGDPTGTLTDAAAAAVAGGDDASAAAAWAVLGGDRIEANDLSGAERWLELARGAVQRIGGDRETQMEIDTAEAERERVLGKTDDALALQRDVVARAEGPGGSTSRLGATLMELGAIEASGGRTVDARATLGRALAILEDTYPASSLVVTRTRAWLVIVLYQLRHYRSAAALAKQVIAAARARQGADRIETADYLGILGAVLISAQQLDAAHDATDQARTIVLAQPIRDDKRLGLLLGNLAIIEGERGNIDAAYQDAADAVDVLERVYPPNDPTLINPQLIAGSYQREAGHVDDAAKRLEAALHLAEQTLPADHPTRIEAEGDVAGTYIAQHRFADAVPLAEHAIAVLARGGDAGKLADNRYTLAQALWETGADRPRALTLAAQAKDGYGQIGDPTDQADVARWLYARQGGGPRAGGEHP